MQDAGCQTHAPNEWEAHNHVSKSGILYFLKNQMRLSKTGARELDMGHLAPIDELKWNRLQWVPCKTASGVEALNVPSQHHKAKRHAEFANSKSSFKVFVDFFSMFCNIRPQCSGGWRILKTNICDYGENRLLHSNSFEPRR